MLNCWLRCWINTRTCITSKWWWASLSLIYCMCFWIHMKNMKFWKEIDIDYGHHLILFIFYFSLQTFAIPGSLFLSILLGFLYRFQIALFLICLCSSLGATLCYCLSNLVGKRLIRHFWPKKVHEWSLHVEGHRGSLFNYILFLRMTPVLPNWFINLVSPVIGVPLHIFAVGTFFGVAPPSIIAIQAGKTLQKLTTSSDAFSWSSMGILTLCACMSLMPSMLKNKISSLYNKTK